MSRLTIGPSGGRYERGDAAIDMIVLGPCVIAAALLSSLLCPMPLLSCLMAENIGVLAEGVALTAIGIWVIIPDRPEKVRPG